MELLQSLGTVEPMGTALLRALFLVVVKLQVKVLEARKLGR